MADHGTSRYEGPAIMVASVFYDQQSSFLGLVLMLSGNETLSQNPHLSLARQVL